jgi:hypothetical protein
MPHTQYGARMTEAIQEPSTTPARGPRRLWLVLAVAVVVVLATTGFAVYRLTASERFDSPRAFADRLAELGVPCGDLKVNEKWTHLAKCQSGKGEMTVEIIGGGMADEQWKVLFTVVELGGPEFAAAYDDEWAIYGNDRAYLRKVADLLGGELRTN